MKAINIFRLLGSLALAFHLGTASAVVINSDVTHTVRLMDNALEIDTTPGDLGFWGLITDGTLNNLPWVDKSFVEFDRTKIPSDPIFLDFSLKSDSTGNTVNVGYYAADGVASTSDFNITPIALTSVSLGIETIFVSLDVTSIVNSVSSTHIGFAFEIPAGLNRQAFLFNASNAAVVPVLRAVPEPSTVALFGLGLAGIPFVRRRRTPA